MAIVFNKAKTLSLLSEILQTVAQIPIYLWNIQTMEEPFINKGFQRIPFNECLLSPNKDITLEIKRDVYGTKDGIFQCILRPGTILAVYIAFSSDTITVSGSDGKKKLI